MNRPRDAPDTPAGRLDDVTVSRRSSLSLPATLSRAPPRGEPRPSVPNAVYAPPSDPRDPDASTPIDLRSLIAAFLLAAVIPTALFVASRPLVGLAGLATLLVLYTGARRATTTVRRLRDDRPLQVDLPGGLRLRVARHPVDPAREEHPVEAR